MLDIIKKMKTSLRAGLNVLVLFLLKKKKNCLEPLFLKVFLTSILYSKKLTVSLTYSTTCELCKSNTSIKAWKTVNIYLGHVSAVLWSDWTDMAVEHWPERVAKLNLNVQVTFCAVLTLHTQSKHSRVTTTGGERKDGKELRRRKKETVIVNKCVEWQLAWTE